MIGSKVALQAFHVRCGGDAYSYAGTQMYDISLWDQVFRNSNFSKVNRKVLFALVYGGIFSKLRLTSLSRSSIKKNIK